jgi:hypothetical protein
MEKMGENAMRKIGYFATLGILVLLLGILSACSSTATNAPEPSTSASEASASTSPAASSSSRARRRHSVHLWPALTPATGVITVIAKDYSFEAPDSVPAGPTTYNLINQGSELHHLQLAKLPEGKTMPNLQAGMADGGAMKWLMDAGDPNAAVLGESTIATAPLEEGQYVMMCVIPSADHTPHVAKGMIKPLQVTAATGSVTPEPAADITLTLKDYAFDLSTPITAGKHTVKVENAGPQPHEVALLQFAPGKTMDGFMAWEQGGEQ